MKKVIYTCITNNYDTLKDPTVITKGWEYICFSDVYIESKTWKVILLGNTSNMNLEQRKKKIYNKFILDDYDLSIWVDGSITINCDLDNFCFMNHNSDFSLMKHPSRDCTYSEASACIMLGKDNVKTIHNQIGRYRLEGLPYHNGMVATGVMIRTHTKEVKEFCSRWYNEVLNGSIRDQLSFNYINWIYPIDYTTFSFNVLVNEFKINKHK